MNVLFTFFRTIIFLLIYTTVWSVEVKKTQILAYGDSVTAGYQLDESHSYPKQLEKKLNDKGLKVEITNGGVSGDTSFRAFKRLNWNLKSKNYDWMILCIGANDGLRNMPVKEMKKNISKIIEAAQAKKIKVLLLGMQLPVNYEDKYRTEFQKVYEDLAKKYKLPFVPNLLEGIGLDPKYNLEDLIHPNKEGYAKVAQKIIKILAPKLEKKWNK